jgi:hypothetical protein
MEPRLRTTLSHSHHEAHLGAGDESAVGLIAVLTEARQFTL